MPLGKPIQIVIVALGSILLGLGLGPLIVSGAVDLFGRGVVSLGVANVVVSILIGITFVLGLVCSSDRNRRTMESIRHLKIAWIASGSIALAGLAVVVAGIDSGNNTAWRSAAQLATTPDINKRQMRELGRHYARLSVPGSQGKTRLIGAIPIDWRAWISGGQADVLLRSRASAESSQSEECKVNGVLVLAAAEPNEVSVETVPIRDICGDWRLIQIAVPRHTTELHISLEQSIDAGATEIDIMPAAIRPHYGTFWTLSMALALGVILTIIYLFSYNLREGNGLAGAGSVMRMPERKVRGVITGGLLFLFLLASNSFMYWYVSQEKTIYTWDYSSNWTSSRHVGEFLRGGERKSAIRPLAGQQGHAGTLAGSEADKVIPDPGALGALIRGIRFNEYNISSNLAVAPVLAIFGGSRMVYELSLLNVYALAAVLMLLIAVRALGGSEVARWPNWWPALPIIVVACLVPFWVPIVRGYMGVSVAAVNLAVLWLYFRQPPRELSTMSLAIIGALLLSGVIMQRWNAYWVVGFFFVAFADAAWRLVKNRRVNMLEILRELRAPLVSGFCAFFLFATIAWPKMVRTITTDQADIYSAFREDTGLFDALARQIDAFGAGILALIAVALLFLVSQSKFRRVTILIGLQILYIFLHFSSTQTMGPHQRFLLLPGLMIILSLGLVCGISSQNRSTRTAAASAAILVLIFGIASGKSVFVPTETGAVPSPNRLLSRDYRPPLVSNDLDEFIRLAKFLDVQMAGAPEEQGIYVLAGSERLNAVHFDTLSLSTGVPFNSADRVLGSSVIDKRDGFPRGILQAYLVVTSDPVQLRGRPTDQHVIQIPADRIFGGTGIGAAFEKLPLDFRLDGNVDAFVFRRTRPNTVAEVADLSNALREIYPDRPSIYQ